MQTTQGDKPANIINHITVIVDESQSMYHLASALTRVFGNLISHLAAQSKANGQETRITVYFFNSHGTSRCVIYDMDVLRVPSIDGLYFPRGMTAMIDAVMLSVGDMRMIPQKYGDHSFLTFVLTDGHENDSRLFTSAQLAGTISAAPENETFGAFVPDPEGVAKARSHGFPEANISVWDASSAKGMENVGQVIRDVADAYMEGRAQGVRGYSAKSGGGLFQMRKFTVADVRSSLVPATPGTYYFMAVRPEDCGPGGKAEIEPFFIKRSGGKPYPKGKCYYEFVKTEDVQGYKSVAVQVGEDLYSGTLDEVRGLLGLPDHMLRVKPDQHPGSVIFIQSTSHNRKLPGGTRLLVMR